MWNQDPDNLDKARAYIEITKKYLADSLGHSLGFYEYDLRQKKLENLANIEIEIFKDIKEYNVLTE